MHLAGAFLINRGPGPPLLSRGTNYRPDRGAEPDAVRRALCMNGVERAEHLRGVGVLANASGHGAQQTACRLPGGWSPVNAGPQKTFRTPCRFRPVWFDVPVETTPTTGGSDAFHGPGP